MMKRTILRFHHILLQTNKDSIWTFLLNKFFGNFEIGKIRLKNIEKRIIIYNLFKNLKEIGNLLFKQNEYKLAIEMYTIALILAPFDKTLERSLNLSNRAQCLIFLDFKIESLIECISALKLQPKHDKSWYRKILVSKRFKDYISCLKIILNVHSLLVKFLKNHTCVQNEIYGKNIIRLGNISLRKKRGSIKLISEKKIQMKTRFLKVFYFVISFLIKITMITLNFLKVLFYHSKILESIFISRGNLKISTKIAFKLFFRAKEIKNCVLSSIFVNFSKLLLDDSILFKIE
jgi:tetratricopeptide (TPR) repeat protein